MPRCISRTDARWRSGSTSFSIPIARPPVNSIEMYVMHCDTPDDTRFRVGPIWSREEADELCMPYRAEGRALRCTIYRNVRGDLRMVGSVGQPNPVPTALAEPEVE
jgi:hypothetical protein